MPWAGSHTADHDEVLLSPFPTPHLRWVGFVLLCHGQGHTLQATMKSCCHPSLRHILSGWGMLCYAMDRVTLQAAMKSCCAPFPKPHPRWVGYVLLCHGQCHTLQATMKSCYHPSLRHILSGWGMFCYAMDRVTLQAATKSCCAPFPKPHPRWVGGMFCNAMGRVTHCRPR